MRTLSLCIAFALAFVPGVALADKDFSTADDGTSWDCTTDARVNINYGSSSFTVTGACDEINVNGSSVKLIAGDVGTLNINGDSNSAATNVLGATNINGTKNRVTYKKAKTGKKPKAAIVGRRNGVTKVK